MSRNSGFSPTTDTVRRYLFIDAGYLNFRLKSWSNLFDGQPFEIDYKKLTQRHNKTFYYDGLAEDDPEHEAFLNSLKEIPDFHVSTGKIKGENKRRRQKQVDVKLTVDALMHTIRDNMDQLTLLAGDEDFTPLISALIQEGMNVTIWAAKDSISKELLYSADRKIDITPLDFWIRYASDHFKEKFPLPQRRSFSPSEQHRAKYADYPTIKTTQDNTLHLVNESDEANYSLIQNLTTKPLQLTGEKQSIMRYLKLLGESDIEDQLNKS